MKYIKFNIAQCQCGTILIPRPAEFLNKLYTNDTIEDNDGVIFFNFADLKWWFELYGRSDEEMNGLSNSLDRKFARMGLNRKE